MAPTINEAFVEQFRARVYHQFQQKGSRLKAAVINEPLRGNVHNFERLGSVAAQQKASRHSDTPILDAPHSRRRVSPVDWEWGDLVDREDKLRMLITPESEYVIAGGNALGRQCDQSIIDAATGNATAGDGSSVPFPAGQQIAHGTSVLTFAKVNAARRLLNKAEADDDLLTFVVSSESLEALLADPKATNRDYVYANLYMPLMAGQVVQGYMGFNWVRSELLAKAANIRSNLAFNRRAIGLAVNEDMFTRVAERPDKSFAHQVYCRTTHGATRIWEEGVVEVQADESAAIPT